MGITDLPVAPIIDVLWCGVLVWLFWRWLFRGRGHATAATVTAQSNALARTGEAETREEYDKEYVIAKDPYRIDVIRRWIQECEASHRLCNVILQLDGTSATSCDHSYLPTRLIDVGGANGQTSPRLVTTAGLAEDQKSRYVALSHCWGNPNIVSKTTTQNLEGRLKKIRLSDLLPSFQDAIRIARCLEIRYLWIDSLCIVQNDTEDVDRECSRMHLTYMHAFCTIAANDWDSGVWGCNAGDYGRLLFDERVPDVKAWRQRLRAGPLRSRGWVYQEYELSPRIIYYRGNGVSWECRKCIAEDEARHMLWWRRRLLDDSFLEAARSRTGTMLREMALDKWLHVVESYSTRALSFKGDKLRALSGLAATFANLVEPGPYMAGHWTEDLIRSLCWMNGRDKPGRRLEIGNLPSWSWASMDGPVEYGWIRSRGRVLPHPDLEIDMAESSVRVRGIDPHGRVSGGKITVSGVVRDASALTSKYLVKYDEAGSWAEYLGKWVSRSRSKCLVLALCVNPGVGTSELGIIITLNDDGETYRRVGYFDQYWWRKTSNDIQRVVIV